MKFRDKLHDGLPATIKSEKGQTFVEYGLVLLLIALVVIFMVKGIGKWTNESYSKVNSSFGQ